MDHPVQVGSWRLNRVHILFPEESSFRKTHPTKCIYTAGRGCTFLCGLFPNKVNPLLGKWICNFFFGTSSWPGSSYYSLPANTSRRLKKSPGPALSLMYNQAKNTVKMGEAAAIMLTSAKGRYRSPWNWQMMPRLPAMARAKSFSRTPNRSKEQNVMHNMHNYRVVHLVAEHSLFTSN